MRVCVVGAGPSGLTTIKQLLDEGHDVTCFEKQGSIGGIWFRHAARYFAQLCSGKLKRRTGAEARAPAEPGEAHQQPDAAADAFARGATIDLSP